MAWRRTGPEFDADFDRIPVGQLVRDARDILVFIRVEHVVV